MLPASDIPDWCTIGHLLHEYRNLPPTDYFHISLLSTGLQAAKGGLEVGLGSVDQGGVLLVVGVLESVINSWTNSRQ